MPFVPFTIYNQNRGTTNELMFHILSWNATASRYCKTFCKLGSAMANVLSASRFIASLTGTYLDFFFFGGAPKAS